MALAVNGRTVAYFSMEVGIEPDLPTYSGGLGILAGDTIKAAADLGVPFVAVTLASRHGYFRQELDAAGVQRERPADWDPECRLRKEEVTVCVPIEGRQVAVQAWRHEHRSPFGGVVPVYFLDTDVPDNLPEDREITSWLYGGDDAYRLKAEIVLGIGGFRMLDALGFAPAKYHLNEGHAALLTLELLRRTHRSIEDVWDERAAWDLKAVRERTIFTTHTPVAAGHDRFEWSLLERILGEHIPFPLLRDLAGADRFNTTLLAMNLSGYINGVAKKHGQVSRNLFRGYAITSVTNGVHSITWTHPRFQSLYDRWIPGWREEPTLLAWVDKIPDRDLWRAHRAVKEEFLSWVTTVTGVAFDPEVLTIGFARRATGYKRADLLLSDLERLRSLGRGRLQIVYAGKAHPRDDEGKTLISTVMARLAALRGEIPGVWLPDYDMRLAMHLIAGVDVWLNTPLRPLEASGTSGMKAAHNGVPNFSVLDGWWIEGHIEGVTGWSIGPQPEETILGDRSAAETADAEDLYRKLDEIIIPLYTDDRAGWVKVMKGAIGKNAYYFNAHRMMRRYVTEAYIRPLG